MKSYFMAAVDCEIERKCRAHKRAFDSCCHEMFSFVSVTVNNKVLTGKEGMRTQLSSAKFQRALIQRHVNTLEFT